MGADQSNNKGNGIPPSNNAQFQSFSNFSPGYIQKLKEKFEMSSDDFTLDKEALKKHFRCSDKECQILFEHFDMDGNGKIDSYELICALAMLSHSTLDEKAELIFSLYDFDGSKYITRDELIILLTNSLSAINLMQKKASPTIQAIEERTDEFFNKSDIDHDKKITLKEFKDYIKKDKQVLEVLISSNVAKKEDLGMDFGDGDQTGVPECDPDLENECNPKDLQRSTKKTKAKEGIDCVVRKSGEVQEGEDQDNIMDEDQLEEGDQFMAVKPWKGVIDHSVPTNYKPSSRDGAAPDAHLMLEYIYGYRCHDARNNLRYTSNNQIIYHAAGVGIVLDKEKNTQKFFLEHNDDIHCLAIDPSGKYCATGQIGPKPWLFVWDTDTMQCLARIQGPLLKGIKNVCFSNDGKLLAASALDDDHNIAIFEWNSKPQKAGTSYKPIASGKGTRANILSIGFNPLNNKLVATCVKEIDFFQFDNGILKGQKGIGWGNNPAETVLCQAYIDNNVLVTGVFSGNLIIWNDRNLGKTIKAHTDGCQALYARKGQKKGLISGGGDGLVKIWAYANGGFQQEQQIDIKMPELKSLIPKVRSVCEHPSGNGIILVGTRGGEIMELGGQKPQVLMRSHCDGELWGLAAHPKNQEFITIGQDNMLAIWDIKTRRQKKFARLECGGNVLAFTSDATRLAIGYINGSITLLDSNFQVLAIRKDRTAEISEIKFSPDNSICAVGGHDQLILTYDVKNNLKPLKKLRGNSSTITHLDFSQDGRWLITNCASYEILFYDVMSGKQNPSGASALKDEIWKTWTCPFGWPVQGIFPPCADGTDINACDRSPDGNVLATGDDFGLVKLFRYPCPVEKASYNQSRGHSSHVTNVRFVPNSPHLISTGGEDKCVFQWCYNFDIESAKESKKQAQSQIVSDDNDEEQSDPMFNEDTEVIRDEIGCTKPFKGEVDKSIPSDFKFNKKMLSVPDGNLKIKYAHGFRSFDTKGNLKYTQSGEVAFTTAALGVILQKQNNTQRFFNLHEEDIVSMAIHPSKDIIATGQMAAKGKAKFIDMFIWSTTSLEPLAKINGFHRRAIRILQFSPNGDKLLSVGDDDQHSVAIYDWSSKRMLCNAKVDPDRMLAGAWKNEQEFVIVGIKCVKFFTIQGQNLIGNKGLYGSIPVMPMPCCLFAFQSQVFLTGSQTGDLIIWNGRTANKTQKAHQQALQALQNISNNSMVISGGMDSQIIIWDQSFQQKKVIDVTPMCKYSAGICSIDYNEQTQTILAGTISAEILEISASTSNKIKTLIYGHFEATKNNELWACTTHPKNSLFASGGSDRTVRIWKVNEMVQVSEQFPNDITALDWSKDGLFLMAGDIKGYAYCLDASTLKPLAQPFKSTLADQKNVRGDPWVEDIKIDPTCQFFAMGTHGGLSKLEIVKILNGGKKLQKLSSINLAVSSAITHLDWSEDSNCVVINSQAYELMWVDPHTQNRIGASSAKDIQFSTWTCLLGFPVQGIFQTPDYSDVNSVCRSVSRTILATGDDFGKVNLFKYPCLEGSTSKHYLGHSSHVTKVKFSSNDQYVVSTGGHDKTVIIWETDFGVDGQQQELEEDKFEEVEEDENDNFNESKIDYSKIAKQEFKMSMKQKTMNASQLQQLNADEDGIQMEQENEGAGDEYGVVKPWLGQMKNPTDFRKPPKNQNKPPAIKMDLEWVHGYRCKDSKNNIGVLIDGSICYNAAALGVVYNPVEHTQRFFNLHIDDVTAIAFSSDRRTIATGEIGPKPSIYLWDSETMQKKLQVKGKLTKGIENIAFSPSGKVVIAVGIDDDHTIAAYNTENGTCLGSNKGDKAKIIEIAMKNDSEFCTAGVKHFMVWNISSNCLKSQRGSFGQKDQRIGSCKYSGESNCLTGNYLGELYIWNGGAIKSSMKLHEKPLDSIYACQQYVLTGGRDGRIYVLSSSNFAQLFSFDILNQQTFQSISPEVKALCLNENQNLLYIGTFGSEIYQLPIDINKKGVGQPKSVIQGHYSPCKKDNNEVWGLATMKTKDWYITVSDDATMRVWDIQSRKQLKLIKLNFDQGQEIPLDQQTNEYSNTVKARCIDIISNGKFAAIGFRDGSIRLCDMSTFVLGGIQKVGQSLIGDLKFSPDGKYLAVSSHDRSIYIFTVPNLKKKCVLKASTSAVTHIDWSLDSLKIHSNDLSYELLYYNLDTGKQDMGGASNYKDEFWNTWTLPLGWSVQGIWPTQADGSDINGVDRSHQPLKDGYHLVASADDFSKVTVFRYPSMVDESQGIIGKGHSSHVTNVKFSNSDNYLLSTGGNDACVFQWKITY